MSTISDQVSYLKGLAEGLKIDEKDNNGKLLLAIIDALSTVSTAIDKIESEQKEMDDYVKDIDDDLSDIEEILFGDDEEEDDDEEEEEEDGEEDGLIEYDCPHCDTTIFFDETAFSMEEDHKCPNCGKPIFGEKDENE